MAIMGVLLYHGGGFYIEKRGESSSNSFNHILSNGFQGVELFFVLSGYILSIIFALKYQKKNHINYADYFIRRITRLEPPYILSTIGFFLMLVFITKKYSFNFLIPHLFASLTYTSNIFYGSPIISGVLWSLEIEVQFYILAPMFCWVLFSKIENFKFRNLVIVLLIIILIISNFYFPLKIPTLYQYSPFFFSGILLSNLSLYSYKKIVPNPVVTAIVSSILICIIFYNNYLQSTLLYRIMFPFIICFLYLLIIRFQSLKFIFQNTIVTVIGGACYSIYLLHYPIISFIGNPIIALNFSQNMLVNQIIHLCILILPVLLISLTFFLLIERPCMEKHWHKKYVNIFKKYFYKRNLNL